jgi:hypothetical protein
MYLHRCFLQIVADYNQVRKKSFPQYFLMVTFVWQAGGKKVSRKGEKAKRKPHQGERTGLKAARNPSTAALCWKSSFAPLRLYGRPSLRPMREIFFCALAGLLR